MRKISNDVMGYKVVANNEVKMFNNVDDVVDYVVMMMKKHPNRAIYVNGFRLTLERTKDCKWSVVLVDADKEWWTRYVMGKIKRGLAVAVSYCVSRIEINNNMEENNMNDMVNSVDMELAIERLADDIADRADKTMGDYFVDVTRYMWNANDDIDEDRLRELLFDKVDGVADIEFAESDDAIVRIWFNRPIKKDVLVGEEQENALESAMNDGEECYDENGMESVAKNDSPCLDEDEYDDNEWSDRDWLIKRTADTIKDYVDNYEGLMMDYDGNSASICVGWDEFGEDMMKNMIEDDNFALQVKSLVYGAYGIKDFLVYDDGVYVSVDAKMFDKVA